MKRFIEILPENFVINRYVRAGAIFGDALSYSFMGECAGFDRMLKKWARWESEYARRGYKPISLDDFIEFGGYGKNIDSLIAVPLEEEPLILHAKVYQNIYSGNIEPAVDLQKLEKGQVQKGTYTLPSTEQE